MSWREGDESGGFRVERCQECGMAYYAKEGHVCFFKSCPKESHQYDGIDYGFTTSEPSMSPITPVGEMLERLSGRVFMRGLLFGFLIGVAIGIVVSQEFGWPG